MNFKNMSIYTLIFLLATLFSCGESSSEPEENNEEITQEELDQLSRPCLDESAAMELPAALADMNNYIQYEQTILINSVLQLSNTLRQSLDQVIYPPSNAVSATVDNITVNASDKGYEWTIGNEKYVYLIREDGYQIYYYADGSLSGREVARLEQDENCDMFEYVQYAFLDDGDQKIGDLVFEYDYQKAGTAKIVDFGTDLYKDDSESYRFRVFEDLSGDISIKTGGKASQYLSWIANGDGRWEIIENNVTIDEGTWTF